VQAALKFNFVPYASWSFCQTQLGTLSPSQRLWIRYSV